MPEALLHELEELELSPYEARVLLALLRLGSANTAELARFSSVPRTSTYQVLEELNRKGLAQRLSVDGPAMWASPGRDEVFSTLDAAQEERLAQHRARTTRLREVVAETFPEVPTAGPYVHVIHGAAQAGAAWNRLIAESTKELLVFNRPPYSFAPDEVNPPVLEAVGRGVTARALYEDKQWRAPESAEF